MKITVIGLHLVFSIQLFLHFRQALGGMCFGSFANGRCKDLLNSNVTQGECCSHYTQQKLNVAWSVKELKSGDLFFWLYLGGGVPCTSCQGSCQDKKCAKDERCTLNEQQQPKCVCRPKCKRADNYLKWHGAVCGNDGRTYKNLCRLRKKACRKKSLQLTAAYKGVCQYSCETVNCLGGKKCLLDRNLVPHCVQCNNDGTLMTLGSVCQHRLGNREYQVCGTDGQSYANLCQLKQQNCTVLHGHKPVAIAYRGPCQVNGTCQSVRCRPRQTCLMELKTKTPRCINCNPFCPRQPPLNDLICGTNHRNYTNWCEMVRDGCAKKYFIDVKHYGHCRDR